MAAEVWVVGSRNRLIGLMDSPGPALCVKSPNRCTVNGSKIPVKSEGTLVSWDRPVQSASGTNRVVVLPWMLQLPMILAEEKVIFSEALAVSGGEGAEGQSIPQSPGARRARGLQSR